MKVKKDYLWYGVTAFLVALVVVVWVYHPTTVGAISPTEAGNIVKDLYSSVYQGMDFKVVNVTDKGDIYEVNLQVSYNGKTQILASGITKDGKYFMPTVLSVEKLKEQIENNNPSQPPKFEPNKTAKPDVELFVMPFCPFGQPAENAMYSVAKLFGDKITYRVHYIIDVMNQTEWNNRIAQFRQYLESRNLSEDQINKYVSQMEDSALNISYNGKVYYISSLHGKTEAKEVIRQLCIWKYYPTKAIDYIWDFNHNCTRDNADTCWTTVATNLGIDTTKIDQCYNNEGVTLAMQEAEIDKKYGASASPTLFVNGVIWNGNRTSAGYQSAICQSFTTQPAECEQTVNETATAPTGSCNS